MPRGKFASHKGKHRHFTNPEEIEEQMKREEKAREWRERKGEESSGEEGSGAEEESSSEEESDEEEEAKAKGVESLIEIHNPNRVQKKLKKVTDVDPNDTTKPELSRKEREALEAERAQANYQRLHAKGKTEEARADLARLAIIKKQREEAAKRREEERMSKEAAKQTKTKEVNKALGKRT
ncbi:28 kDa heat- and acid-stable phosphoprotein-like [Ischnura elegans]|uniref:28 kDa heat- and acid-stable phosphoprotein-like n=1 Tax=Ischnura elegans TaxID=197161 RepID=UPI001ED887E1|nr:28 kDa heat- and acid-stable phosphoprotein-like [Ischnura elegans]